MTYTGHIEFKDGSNPSYKLNIPNAEEFISWIREWLKSYNLRIKHVDRTCAFGGKHARLYFLAEAKSQ